MLRRRESSSLDLATSFLANLPAALVALTEISSDNTHQPALLKMSTVMQLQTEDEVTFLKALSVALQHSAVAADQQNICRLIQVCRSFRLAVQQSTACLTDVRFRVRKDLPYNADKAAVSAAATDVACFALWISSYPGTLRSMDVRYCNDVLKTPLMNERMLAMGLRAATAVPQISSVPAEGSTSPQPSLAAYTASRVATQPLKLKSFCCDSSLTTPLILSALPAATLTQLSLQVHYSKQPHQYNQTHEATGYALGCLSMLRQLEISTECWPCPGHDLGLPAGMGYFSGINKLSQLTGLTLTGVGAMGLELLPPRLQKLDLTIWPESLESDTDDEPPVTVTTGLALSHLTQLQQLRARFQDPRERPHQAGAVSLPKQLQELDVACQGPAITKFKVMTLQQLQKLVLNSEEAPEDLLLLKALPQLKSLHLAYRWQNHDAALRAAPVWPKLQQQLLCLECYPACDYGEMVMMLQAVCTLSNLTKLFLHPCVEEPYDENNEEAEAASWQLTCPCLMLKSLTKLKQLDLNFQYWRPWFWDPDYDWQFEKGDMLHLSCLTGLTQLELSDLSRWLDDAVVAAVLLELTGLQDLTLCGVKQVCILPVIGKLQELTCLRLDGCDWHPEPHDAVHLRGLRKLCQVEGIEWSARS